VSSTEGGPAGSKRLIFRKVRVSVIEKEEGRPLSRNIWIEIDDFLN